MSRDNERKSEELFSSLKFQKSKWVVAVANGRLLWRLYNRSFSFTLSNSSMWHPHATKWGAVHKNHPHAKNTLALRKKYENGVGYKI